VLPRRINKLPVEVLAKQHLVGPADRHRSSTNGGKRFKINH